MLLRSVLLKKEVDLREYADITTRSLDDIRLLKKERTDEGEDYVIVRYDVLGMAQLTLKQSEEKKLRVMFDIVDASGDNEVSWVEFMWFVLFLKKARSRAARAPLPTEPVSWYVRPHGSLIPRRERTSKTRSSRTLPSALFLI